MALASGDGASNIGGGSRNGGRRRSFTPIPKNRSSNYSGDLAPKGPTNSSAPYNPVKPARNYVSYSSLTRGGSSVRTPIRVAERGGVTRPTITPVKTRISEAAVAPFWRPSYLKPGPELRNTLTTLLSNVQDDEEGMRLIGHVLDERYDAYKDRLERRFRSATNDYKVDIAEAKAAFKDGEDFEMPDAPEIQGLKPGLGAKALSKMMNAVMSQPMSEDDYELVSRFFRHEMERVQGIRSLAQDKRQTVFGLTDDFNTWVETQKAKPLTAKQKKEYAEKKEKEEANRDYTDNPIANFFKSLDFTKLDAPGTIERETKDFLSGLFDPVVDKSNDNWLEKRTPDAIQDVLSKIGDEAKDPIFYTMDQLTRPVSGVNNAMQHIYSLNENPDGISKSGFYGGGINGLSQFAYGEDLTSALKNMRIGDLDDIGNAFVEGFAFDRETREGLTLGHDVTKFNAERDDVENIYDDEGMQLFGGLVGDLIADPLNFIGVGVVSKPVGAAKSGVSAYKDSNKLWDLSKQTSEAIKANPNVAADKQLKPSEVYKMLTGRTNGQLPKSNAARKEALNEVGTNIEDIVSRLNAGENVPLSEAQMALKQRWDGILTEFTGLTVQENIKKTILAGLNAGDISSDTAKKFNQHLNVARLRSVMYQARQTERTLEAAAKKWGVPTGFAKTRVDNVPDGHYVGQAEISGVEDLYNSGDMITRGSQPLREGQIVDDVGSTTKRRRKEQVRVQGTKEVESGVKGTYTRGWNRFKEVLDQAPDGSLKAQYQASYDEAVKATEGKHLKDLIPELATDPRLNDDFLDNLIFNSGQFARRGDQGDEFIRLGKEIGQHAAEKAKTEAALRKTNLSASEQSALENKLARTRTKLKDLNIRKDNIQADAMMSLVQKELGLGSRGLAQNQARLDQITEELAQLDEMEQLVSDTPLAQQHRSENAKTHPQMDKVILTIPERRAALQEEYDEIINSDGLAKLNVSKVPPAVGKLDMDRLSELVGFDPRFKRFHPTNRTGDKVADEWMNNVTTTMNRVYESAFDANYNKAKESLKNEPGFDEAVRKRLQDSAENKARKQAADHVLSLIENNKLMVDDYSRTINLSNPVVTKSAFKQEARKAVLEAARKSMDDLQYSKFETEFNKGLKEATEANKILETRLREEAILRIAGLQAQPMQKQLSLRVIGKDLGLPGSQAMFKAAEATGGLPIIKQVRQAFSDAFVSPASKLTPESQLIRSRALGHTPNIIEYHIKTLRNTLGQIPKGDRVASFSALRDGHNAFAGEQEVFDTIKKSFDDLLPYVNNQYRVGDNPITVHEINRFLPREYQINEWYVNKYGVDTSQKLIKAITYKKNVDVRKSKSYKDPYELAHYLRVGIEQAVARKALIHAVNNTFGVKRQSGPFEGTIDQLTKLNWRLIPEMGKSHYFPPEVAPDVNRLLQMMEPENITRIGRIIDRATGYWKTITTVYNPGYWTRNGVGEIMSSWFGGVNDPMWYKRSFDIVKYARGDGRELDALLTQFPGANFKNTDSVPGNKVALETDHFKITNEEAWVWYNDQGLKTGFINTEFDEGFSKAGDFFRRNDATRSVANTHQKVRSAGEWYEDGLRMAHFLHGMKNSGAKTPKAAAEYAAREVRKYHFDYTDFTNFEKSKMLRVFPFYKWTRKALPLMTTMLFTKPGKVMAYPKIMNSVSLGLSSHDIAGDDNGYAPNFEGMAPGWVMDGFGYQIADKAEYDTFFNLATPQMDTYKAAADPGSTAYGLMNPLLRAPVEQVLGTTVGAHFNMTGDGAFNRDVSSMDERIDHLLRQTPQGNYLAKMRGEDDTATPGDHLSFWTGFSFWDAAPDSRNQFGDTSKDASVESKGAFANGLFGGLMGDSGAAAVGPERSSRKSKGKDKNAKTRDNDPIGDVVSELRNQASRGKPRADKPFLTGLANMGNPLPNMTEAELNDRDFGPRVHPVHGGYSNHTGNDYGRAFGTPIIAAANGVVAYTVDSDSAYGNQVILAHGRDKETMYAHLDNYTVKPGQKIKKGDTIGYVGSTGLSTGPHLHFETWVNGNPVDPMNFLGGE